MSNIQCFCYAPGTAIKQNVTAFYVSPFYDKEGKWKKLLFETKGEIRTQYPEATVTSSILLFDVDLIKFRQKKDKRIYSQTIHMLPIRYDINGQIIGQGVGELPFVIENYYYPNVFRRYGLRPLSEIVEIDEQKAQEYQSLLTTYEPFSAINI